MSVQAKVQTFFSHYPTKIYKKGETLIQAGDKAAAFYLASGLVSQYDIAKNGNKLSLNTYKPGAFISLASILNDTPSTFFFEAAQNTTVHVAPTTEVVDFLKGNPDVAYDALTRITRGGDGMMLRLARAMEGTAEGRILQELSILQNRFFHDSKVVTITDTDLAAKTGLARETISRTLKKLNAEGVIRAHRGTITISDTYYM